MLFSDHNGGLMMQPDTAPPQAPYLKDGSDESMLLKLALDGVESEARAYCYSVALVLVSREQERAYLERSRENPNRRPGAAPRTAWSDWQFLAARSGVLAAHNLKEGLNSLTARMKGKPDFSAVDHKALKAARKKIESLFPQARELRDAVSHPEEYHRDKTDTTGGPGQGTWQNNIFEDTYLATFKGQLLRCPLSKEAAQEVCQIVRETFGAFSAIAWVL